MDKLHKRLGYLTRKRKNKKINLSVKLEDINTSKDLENCKRVLEEHGVLFITRCIDDTEKKKILSGIKHGFNKMYRMDGITVDSVKKIPAAGKAGVMGNKNFGYIYKQPEGRENAHKHPISYDDNTVRDVYFTYNTIYYDVILEMYTRQKNHKLLSVILGLSHTEDFFLSWDSVKVAGFLDSKTNTLTQPHIDHYGNDAERYQMILNTVEKRNKLFYVPDTNNKEIRQLLIEITGNKKLFDDYGFKPVGEDVMSILREYALAPPPGSLTIWKSGVVHAEYRSAEKPKTDGLYRVSDTDYNKPYKNSMVVRLITGIHKKQSLHPDATRELAVMAESGFIPHRYIHGDHDIVVSNKMHKAKTQYKHNRKIPIDEKNKFNESIRKLEKIDFKKINITKLALMGVPGIKLPVSIRNNIAKLKNMAK